MSGQLFSSHAHHSASGFTLIELLVVITIIAVLLAMLTPALDRAIYEAEMTMCMANEQAAAQGGFAYTGDYKRHYPYRAHVYATQNGGSYGVINMNNGGGPNSDDRVIFRDYIDVNKTLNCPLNAKLDYVISSQGGSNAGKVNSTTLCYSDYAMWMGMQYGGGQKGMFKLGDRFTWNDRFGKSRSSNALISSFAQQYITGSSYADHPDNNGVWAQHVLDNQGDDWNPVPEYTITWSRFQPAVATLPYEFNMNTALEDNSVVRINNITPQSDESDNIQWAYAWTDPANKVYTPLPAR